MDDRWQRRRRRERITGLELRPSRDRHSELGPHGFGKGPRHGSLAGEHQADPLRIDVPLIPPCVEDRIKQNVRRHFGHNVASRAPASSDRRRGRSRLHPRRIRHDSKRGPAAALPRLRSHLGPGLVALERRLAENGDRIEEAASEATEFGELCEPRDGGGGRIRRGQGGLGERPQGGPRSSIAASFGVGATGWRSFSSFRISAI